MQPFRVKITKRLNRFGRWVWIVNTPGSHVQRRPRIYGSEAKALARAAELLALV